jgi:hypothetical protein
MMCAAILAAVIVAAGQRWRRASKVLQENEGLELIDTGTPSEARQN